MTVNRFTLKELQNYSGKCLVEKYFLDICNGQYQFTL
jgi:hypothetical protein